MVAANIGLIDILKWLVLVGAGPNVRDSVSFSTLLLHGCSPPYLTGDSLVNSSTFLVFQL